MIARRLLVGITGCVAVGCRPSPQAEIAPAAPIVELRLAFPGSGPDRVRYVFEDSVVYLARTAILSDDDFTSVRGYDTGQEELILDITFSQETGQRLMSALAPHVGGFLATLIEGRLTGISRVMGPIGAHGRATMNTMLRGDDAERVRAHVRARWP